MQHIDFRNIDYLRGGNEKQQYVFQLLSTHSIMHRLRAYTPILTGTIPLGIDTDQSDLDIICHWQNIDVFKATLSKEFSTYPHFRLTEKMVRQELTVIASFQLGGFEVEVFGQNVLTEEQDSYRHLIREYELLCQRGPTFKQQIHMLKHKGLKTEPAFAQVLGLKGDPYLALLTHVPDDLSELVPKAQEHQSSIG